MILENFTKELNKTLNQFKTLYDQSLAEGYKHLETLNEEEKKKYKILLKDIENATKEQDSNKLRALIYELKNKR